MKKNYFHIDWFLNLKKKLLEFEKSIKNNPDIINLRADMQS